MGQTASAVNNQFCLQCTGDQRTALPLALYVITSQHYGVEGSKNGIGAIFPYPAMLKPRELGDRAGQPVYPETKRPIKLCIKYVMPHYSSTGEYEHHNICDSFLHSL